MHMVWYLDWSRMTSAVGVTPDPTPALMCLVMISATFYIQLVDIPSTGYDGVPV